MPESIRAKRKAANMAAHARKKMPVILSPDYQYQAMALTHQRSLSSNMADPVRRSTRIQVPTGTARDATPLSGEFGLLLFRMPCHFLQWRRSQMRRRKQLIFHSHFGMDCRGPASNQEPQTFNIPHLIHSLSPLLERGGLLTRETPLEIAARL